MIIGHRARPGTTTLRLAVAATVIACLAGAQGADAKTQSAKGPPLVSVIGPPTYAPVIQSQRLAIRVPLAPRPGVAQGGLRATLANVNLQNRGQKGVFDAFSIALQHRGGKGRHDLALVLRIAPKGVLAAGTYRVRAVVIGSGGIRQTVPFRFRVASAQLKQPDPITVTRTENPWPFHAESQEVTIPLKETSGQSRISGLSVTQGEVASTGAHQASGTLAATPKTQLAPGAAGELVVEPSGDFPLGTATGKVEISAKELAAPIELTYTVRSQYGKFWLLVLLTASVVVGYLIRIGLRRLIKRSEAQAQGQILRNKLNAELGRNPDTAFQAAMAGTADDLETALGEDDPATIEAAVKAAHTKLDAELAALQTRADAVRVRLSTLDALIARSWSVPPSVGPVLATASDEVDAARTALYARDVGAASDATTGLEQHLAGRIAEPARDWRDAVLPLVDVLIDQGPAAPGALDKHVQDAAAAASTALVDPVLTASDATVENLLKGVHTATNAIDRLLGATAAAADETGRQVMYRLSTAGVPDAELEVIRIQRAELGSAFDEAEEMGTGSFTSVMSRLSELGAKMRQVIEKNQRQDADLPAVTAALLRGDFVAAAFTATTPAAPQLEQVQALMGNIAQVGNLVVAARTGPAVGGTQARSDVPAASSAPLPRVAIDRLAPLEELGIARRAAARARHARNFVLGVAVIFVGYLLFADDWTGTTTDLAKVFAWGFGAHFTSDFVATQLAQRTGTSTDSGTGTATTTGNSPTPQAPGQQPPPAQPPAGGGAAGNAAGADGQPAPAAPVPAA